MKTTRLGGLADHTLHWMIPSGSSGSRIYMSWPQNRDDCLSEEHCPVKCQGHSGSGYVLYLWQIPKSESKHLWVGIFLRQEVFPH